MRTQATSFPGALGEPLAARLDRPDTAPVAVALFAHCFTCSKDLKAVGRITRALAGRGVATLRFDFTGLGESEGDFSDTTFATQLGDLEAAAEHARTLVGDVDLLLGHSLGGAGMIAVASRLPSVKLVATIGAPSAVDDVLRHLGDAATEARREGVAEVSLAGRSFRIRRELIEDLSRHNLLEALAALDRPLLVFHSPEDEVVDFSHARRLVEAAPRASLIALEGADHLLLRDPADARYIADVLAAWVGRYLELEEAEAAKPSREGQVQVSIGASGYTTELQAGAHRLTADEPLSVGGANLGPTPYDFVLAGLGACTAMTLRMYADRKSWPLEGVEVALRHERVHAEDCAECSRNEGHLDVIRRDLELKGADLDDAQRQRLLEIADRCPVHRTLQGPLEILTRLLPPEGSW